MASTTNHVDVIVVGGGISGLMAANHLQSRGKTVIVLDKSRVGGRMSTERIGDGLADDAAQFFTVRTPDFQKYVDQWIEEKIVYLWSMGWSDGSLQKVTDDGHARYAVHGGMNAICRRLGQDLKDVRIDVEVRRVTARPSGWTVTDDRGQDYLSSALIMTPPAPQSLELLDAGEVRLSDDNRVALEKIRYEPCLAGMFLLENDAPLPVPGAIQRRSAPISWIANNKQKGISQATIITVQADGVYSSQLWNDDDERVLKALWTDVRVWLPGEPQVAGTLLKRWRYAAPTVLHPERTLLAQGLPTLLFAGDGFGAPRVEGAALSGLAAAAAILSK